MADEEVGSVPENAAPTAPENAPQVGEGGQTAQVQEDPKFAGKSIEDLKEMYRNQEKLLGKQANEVGEVRALRQEFDYLKEYLQNMQRPQERPPEQRTDKLPEFDITNPDAWLDARTKVIENKLRQEYAQREQQRIRGDIASRWEKGKSAFFTPANKHLYDGIERDIEQGISNLLRSNPQAIYDLDNPKFWVRAAKAVRITRDEDDLIAPPRRGMLAPDVEKPSLKAHGGDDLVLDETDREVMRELGWTDKEALEAKRAAVEGINKGLTYRRGQ